MANRYVYSGAGGAGTGADWANAHTTLAAAITAGAAGDGYFIAHDHAQTQASAINQTVKGTAASPDRFLSVNRAGSVPPVAADLLAGAIVTTTGNSAITFQNGCAYFYGITFNAGNSTGGSSISFGGATNILTVVENCALNIVGTGASVIVPTNVILRNCTVSFGAVGQSISLAGMTRIESKPGSVFVTGATIPTTLFSPTVNAGHAFMTGLDLSALGSGKTLVGAMAVARIMRLSNCKIDGSVTMAVVPTSPAAITEFIGCNSTTNVARNELYLYQGVLTTETTIIRTAGASDGTTAYSWKIVTNANSERDFPLETFEGVVWGDTTGSSKTLTIHIVTDNVTLTDAEIWVEVEYLGSSATPVSTLVTDANATVLTTASSQASDSGEAWTTTGLTTPVKQKLEVTFTPQMKGPIRWRVKVAKVSTTVFVCPKADVA